MKNGIGSVLLLSDISKIEGSNKSVPLQLSPNPGK
jgi:hypothetical protein